MYVPIRPTKAGKGVWGVGEKGKPAGGNRKREICKPIELTLDLTRQTTRALARPHDTKRFPGCTHSPQHPIQHAKDGNI